jgi:NADPH-dependent 2,4-dienoyl-CoA reductase/sulfur reductase-like enzyme
MTHFPYLIIGGGMTADAAVHGIREIDPEGPIGVIGAEPDPPYNRPPLSKGLWKGDDVDGIWRDAKERDIHLFLGVEARVLDPAGKRVTDGRGTVYSYDRLLLATGGSPRRLPFGGDRIIYYRTLDDYRRLRRIATTGARVAVIGGGFIGSEIAAGLAMNDCGVVMIFPEPTLCSRVFPADLGEFMNGVYRDKGLELLPGVSVQGVEDGGAELTLAVRSAKAPQERKIVVDAIVAGIGILPNVDLAQAAGLEIGDGIEVDERLRTSVPEIYAAGDVALFWNPDLGKRMRAEHEDNANTMGRIAGRNMAGGNEPYRHLPSFYSDLFEYGYEAVGELDSRLQVVADWKEAHREGVLYYLREERVRGVLLWNVWGQVDAARRLIADRGPFRVEDLKGRLPEAESASH